MNFALIVIDPKLKFATHLQKTTLIENELLNGYQIDFRTQQDLSVSCPVLNIRRIAFSEFATNKLVIVLKYHNY